MNALECVHRARLAGAAFQTVIDEFVSDFRRATCMEQRAMVHDPIWESGKVEGLVAGVVSALCREAGIASPGWLRWIGSPEPYFPYPAATYAMRIRLMVESPAAFRTRNVFVPENYLSRV